MEQEKLNVISCSFGKDSIATVILAHEHNIPIDMIIYSEVMYDIKNGISGEVPEHRDFIYNVAIPTFKKWGYKVVVVQNKVDYLANFNFKVTKSKSIERIGKTRGFPLVGLCNMGGFKIKAIKNFYKNEHIKQDKIIQYVGIAIDETKRLKRLEGTNKVSLLAKYNYTEEDAKELCEKFDLLSPIYNFTSRGGCWFCPNCKIEEFAHMKKYHKELWQSLVELDNTDDLISHRFNRTESIVDIDKKVDIFIEQNEQ